jgi:hypothetical protein
VSPGRPWTASDLESLTEISARVRHRREREAAKKRVLRRLAEFLDALIYMPGACNLPGHHNAVDFVEWRNAVVSLIPDGEGAGTPGQHETEENR